MAFAVFLIGLFTNFCLVTRSDAHMECGERYLLATDEFSNLTFNHTTIGYHLWENCIWTIRAENDSSIVSAEVTTTDLNLLSHTTCSRFTNNITAYDGVDPVGDKVLRWCMQETPTVTSSGRYLTFQLSLSFFLKGGAEFSLQYKQEVPPAICNGTLSSNSRFYVFTSHGYPKGLQKNQNCNIVISTSSRYVLKLTVIDADVGSSCIYIYDGLTASEPLLNSTCGTHVLTSTSSGKYLLVTFSTGDNPTGKGFKMKYRSISNIYACPQRTLTAYSNRQEIKSPFYPYTYPVNADCTWVIDAYFQTVIYIEMTEFELEESPGCTADYLQIYDGYELYSMGKWCGNRLPPSLQSTRHHVTIKFHSNGRVAMSGFRLGFYTMNNQSSSPEPSFNFGLLSAAIVLVIICIGCICCCIACRKKRHARHGSSLSQTIQMRRARTAQPARPGTQQTVYTVGGDTPAQNTIPANFLPPPTYDEVFSKDIINGTGPSPPPYSTVGVSSDSHPSNSTPKEDNDETCDGAIDVQTQL